ncbi:MAG: Mth938-like domain-containing protein [Gammaproteobacteria bacterium]
MQVNDDTAPQRYQIRSYQPGRILINEIWHTSPVMIHENQLISPWPVSPVATLTVNHLILLDEPLDIILLGTGEKFINCDPLLRHACYERKIALEAMDTRSACGTYLILTSENRRVAAALFL